MNNRNQKPRDDRELDRQIDALFQARVSPADDFVTRAVEAVQRERVRQKRRRGFLIGFGGAAAAAAALALAVRLIFPVEGPLSAPLTVAEAVVPADPRLSGDLEELFTATSFYSEAIHLEALLADAGALLDDDHEHTLDMLAYLAGL